MRRQWMTVSNFDAIYCNAPRRKNAPLMLDTIMLQLFRRKTQQVQNFN